MLCMAMKSQHALKLVKFLDGQHGLAIGELKIFSDIILSPGILAWFCLTANDNRTYHIYIPTVMFHFSSFSPARAAAAPAALFPATIIMLII